MKPAMMTEMLAIMVQTSDYDYSAAIPLVRTPSILQEHATPDLLHSFIREHSGLVSVCVKGASLEHFKMLALTSNIEGKQKCDVS